MAAAEAEVSEVTAAAVELRKLQPGGGGGGITGAGMEAESAAAVVARIAMAEWSRRKR